MTAALAFFTYKDLREAASSLLSPLTAALHSKPPSWSDAGQVFARPNHIRAADHVLSHVKSELLHDPSASFLIASSSGSAFELITADLCEDGVHYLIIFSVGDDWSISL